MTNLKTNVLMAVAGVVAVLAGATATGLVVNKLKNDTIKGSYIQVGIDDAQLISKEGKTIATLPVKKAISSTSESTTTDSTTTATVATAATAATAATVSTTATA